MGELTLTELYLNSLKTQQVWRAVLSWLGFFFQIFSQITGAFAHYPLLSFSSSSSSSHSFDPLPTFDSPPPSALQITSAAVHRPLQKLTVVLDLDETLVCAYETSSLPVALCAQANKAGLNWFELECVSSGKEVEGKPKINYITVFERPGLKEFLRQLSYARPLVDRIDTENRFCRRLYRSSTIGTKAKRKSYNFDEELEVLNRCLRDLSLHGSQNTGSVTRIRTGISGTCERSYLHIKGSMPHCYCRQQPLQLFIATRRWNSIFSAGQPHDTQLLDVILPLLKHLTDQKDVRHVLYEKFHMPEWFQKQRIPASS